MPSPTSRLLELLELLESRTLVTGQEIAGRLGVDRRTVRRYVDALQELGIPVEGQRGVGGGYRMRPGYRLAPLMLDDDEAVAVVLGLVAARRLGLAADGEHPESALEKIHRILPAALRRRVEALENTLAFTGEATVGVPVSGGTLLVLAEAIRRRRRLRVTYTSFSGERSRRRLSPYALVVHAGRWYLAAHDHERDDLRTFRVDRMGATTMTDTPVAAPPPGFDAVAHVSRSLASVPWRWTVEVVLELELEDAARRIPATLAELIDEGGRTTLRMRVSSLAWMAGMLAGLDCGFTIVAPDELRDAVRALAGRLASQVSDDGPDGL